MPVLPKALLAGLIDDAAVFPPGSADLDVAVARHRGHRRAWYAEVIGPLLLPPASVAAAIDLAGLADLAGVDGAGRDLAADDQNSGTDRPGPSPSDGSALGIGIAARPDTPIEQIEAAAHLAAADSRVALLAVEHAWFEGWERLDVPAPAIVVELPRGTEQALPITEIAIAIAESPQRNYAAKFRTGATQTWAWPSESELARTIQAAVAMEVPLKLTGGLHHALRGRYGDQENHGLLNVLATFAAARKGRPVPTLRALLALREPGPLLEQLAGLSVAEQKQLRADFPSYGCCDVGEPIGELAELGALEGDPA